MEQSVSRSIQRESTLSVGSMLSAGSRLSAGSTLPAGSMFSAGSALLARSTLSVVKGGECSNGYYIISEW